MAARFRIIALTQNVNGPRIDWKLVFWYDVPASRQKFFANATAKSAWIDAQAGDNTALQNGSVFEEIVSYSPDGAQTQGQIAAGALALWNQKNTAFQANNPWVNYGTTNDPVNGWVIATVA
jgi:hypothetical protein